MKWKTLDIIYGLGLIPLLLSLSLFIAIYWVGYFPIWLIKRWLKTKKIGSKQYNRSSG